MPELPEVETIKNDFRKLVQGSEILGINATYPEIVKNIDFNSFKKQVIGFRISDVKRRAKSLIFELSKAKETRYLLVHLKMTGHFITTSAKKEVDDKGNWIEKDDSLKDPLNQYIRIQFFLDNGKQIAFSDLRKFAYIKLVTKKELDDFLNQYGPEPLENEFNVEMLAQILKNKRLAIKKVLMDQKNIAGIGNIYADEILFYAGVHPLRASNSLSQREIEKIFTGIKEILTKAIELRGTSTSDYRDAKGEKGSYGNVLKVYRKTGQPCPKNCGGVVKRITIGGRGTHYCENCQNKKEVK